MTYRDRRYSRADRLDGWAEKREAKADADFAGVEQIAGMIPLGQPILVGHHSEGRARRDQERIRSGMRRGIDNQAKAEEFSSKAANIRAAADHAIYDDDHDALARLLERIEGWEAERKRIRDFNAVCRKAGKVTAEALEILDEKQRADLLGIARVASYQLGPQGQFPGYVLSNLGGCISKAKKRLPVLERRATDLVRVREVLAAEAEAEEEEP